MSEQQPKRGRGRPKKSTEAVSQTAEELALFYHWRDVLLPKLTALSKTGTKPEDMLAEFSSAAATRLITIALSSPDQKVSLSALQDVLDRAQGKATQKTIVEGKFARLKDEEIDALYAEAVRPTNPNKDQAN